MLRPDRYSGYHEKRIPRRALLSGLVTGFVGAYLFDSCARNLPPTSPEAPSSDYRIIESIGHGEIEFREHTVNLEGTPRTMLYTYALLLPHISIIPITAYDQPIIPLPNDQRRFEDPNTPLEPIASFASCLHNPTLGQLICYIPTDYFSRGISNTPEGCAVNNLSPPHYTIPNPNRLCLKITADRHAYVGTYILEQLADTQVAFGTGPLCIYPDANHHTLIAGVNTPDLYFANQLYHNSPHIVDDYLNNRPKGILGYGSKSGTTFIVMAASDQNTAPGITGPAMAAHLADIGVTHAALLDSGSSSSFAYLGYGQSIHPRSITTSSNPIVAAVYRRDP